MTPRTLFARPAAALLGTLLALSLGAGAAAAQPRYRDGEFAGQPADTEWGLVQVKVAVRGGALVDVQYLQYPSHRRRIQGGGSIRPAVRDPRDL